MCLKISADNCLHEVHTTFFLVSFFVLGPRFKFFDMVFNSMQTHKSRIWFRQGREPAHAAEHGQQGTKNAICHTRLAIFVQLWVENWKVLRSDSLDTIPNLCNLKILQVIVKNISPCSNLLMKPYPFFTLNHFTVPDTLLAAIQNRSC